MIKQVSKSTATGMAAVGGYGAVGVYIESVVHAKWPTLGGAPGVLTMAFTALAHGVQRAWYSWMETRKKAP